MFKRVLLLLLMAVLLTPIALAVQCEIDPEMSCPQDIPIDSARELMITDLSVVEDCARTTWGPCPSITPAIQGAWTFGRLAEGLAGTDDPEKLSKFVMDWLGLWLETQEVNSFKIPPRTDMKDRIITPWLKASGGKILDMKLAPFRLLAIVYRPDLRNASGYGSEHSAGEGRFVFGVLDRENPARVPLFTVILEYNLKAKSCEEVKVWAKRWHELGQIPFGNKYNAHLEKITESFSGMNVEPSRPNGSGINQVRTNDFFLARPWELREHILDPGPHPGPVNAVIPLISTTIKQNPEGDEAIGGFTWNHTELLAKYVNESEAAILDGTYVVPEIYKKEHFLGAAARYFSNTFWTADGIENLDARHLFSKGTCSGCHAAETGTGFTHVDPRPAGVEAAISRFLEGDGSGGPFVFDDPLMDCEHHYNQLLIREDELCKVLVIPCKELSNEQPKSATH